MNNKTTERLFQHQETGRMLWHRNPGSSWIEVPLVIEDELPADTTDGEYDAWYEASRVVDGARIGPMVTRGRRSDLKDMLLWALGAAAITLVFRLVLDVLEAVF